MQLKRNIKRWKRKPLVEKQRTLNLSTSGRSWSTSCAMSGVCTNAKRKSSNKWRICWMMSGLDRSVISWSPSNKKMKTRMKKISKLLCLVRSRIDSVTLNLNNPTWSMMTVLKHLMIKKCVREQCPGPSIKINRILGLWLQDQSTKALGKWVVGTYKSIKGTIWSEIQLSQTLAPLVLSRI